MMQLLKEENNSTTHKLNSKMDILEVKNECPPPPAPQKDLQYFKNYLGVSLFVGSA